MHPSLFSYFLNIEHLDDLNNPHDHPLQLLKAVESIESKDVDNMLKYIVNNRHNIGTYAFRDEFEKTLFYALKKRVKRPGMLKTYTLFLNKIHFQDYPFLFLRSDFGGLKDQKNIAKQIGIIINNSATTEMA